MDTKKKFFLFKKYQHFCSVPWNHLEIFSDGSIKTCSSGRPFGNINKQPLAQILSNSTIRQIKQDLLENKLIDNCRKCHIRSTGNEHFDLRNHYNPMFQKFDIDYDNLDTFQLNAIDLHWDNTCNLKCVYCNPWQSSMIAAEQGIRFEKPDQENINKIIDMIVQNQYNMREIYLSGGEPLLIKHNLKLLKSISNKDLPIRINSNITMAKQGNLVFQELSQFKNVLWTISAETQAEKFNYIRHGSDWKEVIDNLKNIKQLGHNLRLNAVFFIGAVVDIFDTIEYFIRQHQIRDITINQLDRHEHLLARNAPEALKKQARERLNALLATGLVEHKSNSYYNIARCLRELDLPADDTQGYQDYFDRLDQIRNTNWRQIFPELVR